MSPAAADAFTALESERSTLARSSTAERVADIMRERITEGSLAPGSRLPRGRRRLGPRRLPQHPAGGLPAAGARAAGRGRVQPRGVRPPAHPRRRGRPLPGPPADRVRGGATGRRGHPGRARGDAPGRGRRRAGRRDGRWPEVGTANMRFHQSIVAMVDSPRLDEHMRQVTAELRLAFHVMANPRAFHEPYLRRNRELAALIEAGDGAAARTAAGHLSRRRRTPTAGHPARSRATAPR